MSPAARAAVRMIDWYRGRRLGERLVTDCNFEPSCSAYAREAICRHGFLAGTRLAAARVRRCNDRERVTRLPDPVP